MKLSNKALVALWFFAVVGFTLVSPKWTFAPAAWFAPGLLLIFLQQMKGTKGVMLAFLGLFISSLISNYHVVPFPDIVFVIVTMFGSAFVLIPYLMHRWLFPKFNALFATLIFPAAFVLLEYAIGYGSGKGTWGMLGYSQAENSALMQLASVTGIWGISFMVYWFGSVMAVAAERGFQWAEIRIPVITFATVLLTVLFFGTARINPYFQSGRETVRVAGITGSNLHILKSMYEDAFGKPGIDLEALFASNKLSITSPELQEMQKAFVPFIEDPAGAKFTRTRSLIDAFSDSLFKQAAREAMAGAKIISFSEAILFTDKENETALLSRGLVFARNHKVHLMLTAATILKGPVDGQRKFMENKSWLIGPEGTVLNVFLKNRPVPVAEAGSVPGDGVVPVVPTSVGNLSSSICYDADFPSLIRQAGEKHADILILPSGDWREISPYHARMAAVRSIENGFSLLRTVSGATSVACNKYGQVVASRNYFDQGAKVLIAYLPIGGARTIYSQIGDVFVYVCAAIVIWVLGTSLLTKISRKKNAV